MNRGCVGSKWLDKMSKVEKIVAYDITKNLISYALFSSIKRLYIAKGEDIIGNTKMSEL